MKVSLTVKEGSANVEPQPNDSNHQAEEPERMDPGTSDPIPFNGNIVPNHPGDLDRLQATDGLVHDASLSINFNLDAVDENMIPSNSLSLLNLPSTAAFAPFMQEVFILKEVDEFLFCHPGKLERLAAAYKSFKLLKTSMRAVLF